MKHSFIWLILCLIGSPCVSPILGQDCQPITGTSDLARTSNTINQTIGVNAGFDIERFFGNIPGYSYNQDSILLADVMETSPIIRFFYSQNKDYDNRSVPKDYEDIGSLNFDELINVNDRSTHLTENYVRIFPLFEAGFEVQVAVEISHGKAFPDKWWTLEELSEEAHNNSSPNMSRVISEVTAEGKDWATAFLKVYDPKNANGDFTAKPVVTVLELGNEPWGSDLGVEGFRAYINGMYEAFVDYYDHTSEFRIKLASAAFQGHAAIGSDFYNGTLLDYAGTMIGDEGNSLVDLGPLRNALTEGVGVHNYSFTDYCDIDANTLINHPERTNNGFMAYKNISEWVTNNMPAGSQKVNATEYGWNSDYEPRLYFPCAEGKVNEWGGCDEVANYDEVVAISMDGRKYDYNEEDFTDQISQQIVGRTAQAAYIVRSTIIMNRWGVNKAMLYGLLDDWANPLYFSNGLIDTDRAQSSDITLDELKDIEPNPSGKKESWYAVKRLKEILGDKYFIEQYGSETDGGTYTYAFGDHENGPPTHLVTWNAININELNDGAYVNTTNNNNNINSIQEITTTLDLTSLNLPAGASIDLSQPSIYLNGKLNNDWKNTQELLVNNDPTRIQVSPIPVVIPLQLIPTSCNNTMITQEQGLVSVSNTNGENTHIQIMDLSSNNIVFDNQNLTTSEEMELTPGDYEVLVDGENCQQVTIIEDTVGDPPANTLQCQGATIHYGEGQISVVMNDEQNAGIKIHDLLNGWVVVANNNYQSDRLEVDLPEGEYLIKINSQSCQTIELSVDPPADNEFQCMGATITYGAGQIAVVMDNEQNAGIKIHDLQNGWAIVANNNYQSNDLLVDLPEGEYLVKINSNECEEIYLASAAPEPGGTICSEATIEFLEGTINVLMHDRQQARIEILDEAGESMVNRTVPRIQLIVEDLLPGSYTVIIDGITCQEIMVNPVESSSFGNDNLYPDKSITLFPNPAQDYIQVHLPKLAGRAGTIQVYDAYGQIITEHTTQSLNNYERLDLSKARNGLYYMTIKAKDKRRIGKRFVVEDTK